MEFTGMGSYRDGSHTRRHPAHTRTHDAAISAPSDLAHDAHTREHGGQLELQDLVLSLLTR